MDKLKTIEEIRDRYLEVMRLNFPDHAPTEEDEHAIQLLYDAQTTWDKL